MADNDRPGIGAIVWQDLTVADAPMVRDFYTAVVGWTFTPHDMGDYDDFNIQMPDTNEVITGICHARGENAGVPPQWLMYVNVADLDASIAQAEALGGKVVHGPRLMGDMRFVVIQDPAGAVIGLMSTP